MLVPESCPSEREAEFDYRCRDPISGSTANVTSWVLASVRVSRGKDDLCIIMVGDGRCHNLSFYNDHLGRLTHSDSAESC